MLPHAWPECEVEYRHGGTLYRIRILRPGTLTAATLAVERDG